MASAHFEGDPTNGFQLYMSGTDAPLGQPFKLDGQVGTQQYRKLDFVETAAAGTYTAQITVPSNAIINYVSWETTAGWANTTAALSMGYTGALTDYVNAADVKAAGEAVKTPIATVSNTFHSAGTVFNAVLTTTGGSGTTGRTYVIVGFCIVPTATTATKV